MSSAHFVKNLNASYYSRVKLRVVEYTINNHYVDNFVDSFEDVRKHSWSPMMSSLSIVKEVSSCILYVKLRRSTSLLVFFVLAVADENQNFKNVLDMDTDVNPKTKKILGMYWDSGDDVFGRKTS